jgi:hypothetical protein
VPALAVHDKLVAECSEGAARGRSAPNWLNHYNLTAVPEAPTISMLAPWPIYDGLVGHLHPYHRTAPFCAASVTISSKALCLASLKGPLITCKTLASTMSVSHAKR